METNITILPNDNQTKTINKEIVTLDNTNKNQLDEMRQNGYLEAQAGIGLPLDIAFQKIRESM